jgi:hypothetical protein
MGAGQDTFAAGARDAFAKHPVTPGTPARIQNTGGVAGGCTEYLWDDGTGSTSIGLTNGGDMVWANDFTVTGGCTSITSIKIAWGVIPNGSAAKLYVMSDPNQDGNPADATVLASVDVMVANTDTDVFNVHAIGPVTVTGRFFISARAAHVAGQFPARVDQTDPDNGHSWVGFGFTDPNNPWQTTPSGNIFNLNSLAGLEGDLMLRATAGAGNPCTIPLPFCNANVNNTDNANVVNIDDLFTVIGTWGQTQTPPGTGPRPQGDCHPVPLGNCMVNIDDLFEVIGKWGPCPVPTGACCFSDGSCQVLSQANCGNQGGTYRGNGTTCPPTPPCPVLPPNDECNDATNPSLVNGHNFINNSTATQSTNPPASTTCPTLGTNVQKDLWYKYTATCTGPLTFDTCSTTGGVTDTVLIVYTGNCANLVEVGCNDDSSACGSGSFLTSLTLNTTMGTQYRLRIGTWGGSPGGAIDFNITCVSGSNDLCAFAETIAVGGSASGTLEDATAGNDTAPGCNGVNCSPCNPTGPLTKGKWYKVTQTTGNSVNLTASTCTGPAQTYNMRISVYCGNDCSQLFCIGANDGNSCNFFQESITWCAANNQMYWILLWNPDNNIPAGQGLYTLTVTNAGGAGCTPLPCASSVPDECASAAPVILGDNAIDNTGATTSTTPPVPTCAGAANFTRDTWYTYTPNFTGALDVSTCTTTGSVTDSVLAAYTGDCSSATLLACDDDACAGAGGAPTPFLSRLAFGVSSGVQVKLRVASWGTSPAGPMTLRLAQVCTVTCPGNAENEGEACLTAAPDNTNGGCNSTPTVFGTVTVNGPAKCGLTSTYMNGTTQSRDTDWYRFGWTAAAQAHIEINANIGVITGFVTATNTFTNGTACTGAAFVSGSTALLTPAQACTNVNSPTVTLNLNTPQAYCMFVAPLSFGTAYACSAGGKYWARTASP